MTTVAEQPGNPLLNFEPDEVVENLVHLAGSFCSAAASGFFWLDSDENLSSMLTLNCSSAMYADYLHRINVSDPLHVRRMISARSSISLLDHAIGDLDQKQVAAYRAFLDDYDVGDEVDFVFRHEARPIGGMALMRRKGDRPFAGEAYDWDLMHRHFETVLQNHANTRAMIAETRLTERFGLTRRERQLLGFLVNGLNNVEVSEAMGISLSTTKTHIANILDKMGVSNRTAAVALTLRIQLR